MQSWEGVLSTRERSCDGGAAFSPPRLAPVRAHPVPFASSKGDPELQNSGSEARRCCRAGEEEEPWVEHSRGEAPVGSRVCDRHHPPAWCHQRLLQKSSAGASWVLPAQSWALPAQTSSGERRCGLGKGMSWLCPCVWEAPDVGAEAARAVLGSGCG